MPNAADPPDPSDSEPKSAAADKFMEALKAFEKSVLAANTEQSEAAALAALAAATEEAEKNPTPQFRLQSEAGECEARGDWAGAEACYGKILAMEEEAGNSGAMSKAHYDLSKLFLLVGDLDKAEVCARAATAAARQSGMPVLLVMMLELQATCALARSDLAAALEATSEAVAAVEPEPLYDGQRAGALVARAHCRMTSGDWSGAESDLAASEVILLGRGSSPIMAGSNSRAARWWELTARARAHRGDQAGACQASAKAVQFRRHVASLPHVAGPYTLAALARALHGSGKALEAAGNLPESEAAMDEARRIWRDLGLQEQAWR